MTTQEVNIHTPESAQLAVAGSGDDSLETIEDLNRLISELEKSVDFESDMPIAMDLIKLETIEDLKLLLGEVNNNE